MYRKQVISRTGEVEREHRVADVAVRRLIAESRTDPTILHAPAIESADIRRCVAGLEQTYLVRMFSVFEEYLRDVWATSFHRLTHPPMFDLLQGCAAHQSVPHDHLANAHRVRDFRNSIVHGDEAEVVPLALAREYLCTFFGRMPPQW